MPDGFMVTINGERWRLEFSRLSDRNGDCDPPTAPGKTIRIASRLLGRQQRLMADVLHECLHAADWSKDEEWVEQVSEDLARILFKLGYRRTDAGVCHRSKGQSDGRKKKRCG